MRTVLSLAVVPLLIPLAALSAQEPPPIEAGSRIRVTAPTVGADKLVGMCVEVDATRLRIQAGERVPPRAISLTDVTRLEVSQGRKSNALKGLLIGGLVGTPIGAAVGGVVGSIAHGLDEAHASMAAYVATGALVFGAAGGLVGLGIGALSSSERWKEVPLDRLRVSFVARRDGRFALGVSVAF